MANFFGSNAGQAINAINASTESLEIGVQLPLFAAWAIGMRRNLKDALSFILELGQTPNVIALRKRFDELDAIRSSGDALKFKRDVNKLCAAVESECAGLVRKYGGSPTGAASCVSLNAQLAPIPSLSFGANADLSGMLSRFGASRRLRAIVRNVVTDVTGFDDLGSVRAALLANVRRSDDFSVPALRIEERRYFGKAAHWKKPM